MPFLKEQKMRYIATAITIILFFMSTTGCIFQSSVDNGNNADNNDELIINEEKAWHYNVLINSPEKFSCSLASGRKPSGEFTWDFGDGTRETTKTAEITHEYSTPGTKIVNVTYKSGKGGNILEAEIVVLVIETVTVPDVIYGKASYYGDGRPYGGLYDGIDNGTITSSGEPYDNNGYTAATWEIYYGVPVSPMNGGTDLLVTNINNGKSVRVRVNDRGPYHFSYTGTPDIQTMMDSGEFNNENLTYDVINYERHYTGGRVIDLTPRAFFGLDNLSIGVIEVRIDVV